MVIIILITWEFFFTLVEEWRSKWFLESHWQRCGTEELITAMGDINDHIRLSAVSACSKAAELRHAKKQEHHLGAISIHIFPRHHYGIPLIFY